MSSPVAWGEGLLVTMVCFQGTSPQIARLIHASTSVVRGMVILGKSGWVRDVGRGRALSASIRSRIGGSPARYVISTVANAW